MSSEKAAGKKKKEEPPVPLTEDQLIHAQLGDRIRAVRRIISPPESPARSSAAGEHEGSAAIVSEKRLAV